MDWLIFGSINIIILVVMFLFLSRRLRRQYNAGEFLAQVQQEVNSIVTELNQTTERNIQLLEERISRVKDLLSELDRRILIQESEAQKRSQTDRTYQHLKDQRRAILRDLNQAAPAGSTADAVAPVIQGEMPVKPSEAVPPAAAPVLSLQRATSREALKAQVVEWFLAGMAPSLIAQQAGITLGEVELIISLHGSRPQ